MVLGMLALLVIMGVTFAISMRTERLATRYYLDGVKARHQIHTALARALSEIDFVMDGRAYPEWDAFVDSETVVGVPAIEGIALLGDGTVRSPMAFVPASLRSAAAPLGYQNNRISWLPLQEPGGGRFHGEYTYLVVNNSGLLDANYIGANEAASNPRSRGVDVGEIRFHPSILRESINPTLHVYRDEFVRFESLPELHYLCSGTGAQFFGQLGAQPLHQAGAALTGPYTAHLHVFSRYPAGYADNNLNAVTNNVAYIGGDPSQWDETAIENALEGIIPEDNRAAFINAMYDYADAGLIPRELRQFTTKPVPLINEIVFEATAEAGNDPDNPSVIFTATFYVETAYLFANAPPGGNFSVAMDSIFIQVANTLVNFTRVDPDPTPITDLSQDYQVAEIVFRSDEYALPPDNVVSVRPQFVDYPDQFGFVVLHNGQRVDQVIHRWQPDDFLVDLNLTAADPRATRGWAVNDPRINWDPSNRDHWHDQESSHSLGQRNNAYIDGNADELDFMFAALRPFESVGELGYLLYDAAQPWATVRFIGNDLGNLPQLLDRFTVHEEPVRRGLVNVNTRQASALAAALWTLPRERYPEDPDGDPLSSVGDTEALAGAWVARVEADGPLNNLSDLSGVLSQIGNLDSYMGSAGDKFRRESVLRNSLGLLGVRHNLFTVFLATRVFSEGYDPDNPNHFANRQDFVTGEERAVAVVWRDPYQVDGVNHTRIKYFHWLTAFE